jgi:HPt (histidine-containing phosphotransfer) domain-containing protein
MTAPRDDSDLLQAAVVRLRDWGGYALVREMSAIFFEDAQAHLTTARVAASDGDPVKIARAMHALKSSAGQVGAIQVQRLCERAEQNALAGDIGAAGLLIGEISAAIERFHVLLLATMPTD